MNSFFTPLLLSVLFTIAPFLAHASAGGGAPVTITPDLLDRLVDEARTANPGLQAAAARVQASAAEESGVRTWEDPTASFGLWTSGSGGFQTSEQGNLVYGIEQKLPLQGRPELRRKVAAADAERERFESDFETRKIRHDLTDALVDLAMAGREADLAREDLAWLDAAVSAIDHRYRVGRATQVDWLKAQTARALAANALVSKEQERDHHTFFLNRLLNRELHSGWPAIALPPLQPRIDYTPELVEAAIASEPQLKVLRQESVAAQAAADLTRRARRPDVSLGLQAWQYSGNGSLKQAMATVNFSVPWFNRSKYDSDWRRDQARYRASEFAADDYALGLREELHHHIVDLDAIRRQAALEQRELIPLTEQTLASAQAAWEHGGGSFQDILDAHRMLIGDRVALAEALAQQSSRFADLCLLTGSRDPAAVVALGRNLSTDKPHLSPEAP